MPIRQIRLLSVLVLLGLALFGLSSIARAENLTVDCGAGDRLQAAIDRARPGDTIVVTGICDENVTVREEAARLMLDGQGAATIHGRLPGPLTVTVLGRAITVKGFTITGGRAGVAVLRGGTAVISGYAQIINNTLQANPVAGIRVQEGSYARIGFLDPADPAPGGNTIRDNGVGVLIQRVSGATLVGNTISDNAGAGVSVGTASTAQLAGNRVDGNREDGVQVSQDSAVQLGDGAGLLNPSNETQAPNSGFGIRCSLNASVDGHLGTLTGAAGARRAETGCIDNASV